MSSSGHQQLESYSDIPFRAIVEQSLVGVYVMQDERFPYVNATFAAMLGYTPAEMMARTLDDLVPADWIDEVRKRYQQRISSSPPEMQFVTRGLHRDGHVVMIEVHGARMEYRGRPAVVGVAVNVTERLRNEAELQRSRADLRELAAHMNTVRETQRARYARELHDVLGGMLTSIKMDVTRVLRRANSGELRDIAKGALELTQEAIAAVRAMSEELRPSTLDLLGLAAAIERELKVFARRHDVAIRFEAVDVPDQLSPEISTAFYRIFQEATTNVARHAAASCVRVKLYLQDGCLCLDITDDGNGIDLTAGRIGAIGVLGMTERARELGGTLQIGCHDDRGTKLRVTAPLAREGNAT